MVNISDKVTQNRFHWFHQFKAYIPLVPPQFLEPESEPEPVPEPPREPPKYPLDQQEPKEPVLGH